MVVKTSDLGGAVICNGSSSGSSRRGRRRRSRSSNSSRCEQVKRMNLVVLRGVEYRHIWSGVWCSQPLPHPANGPVWGWLGGGWRVRRGVGAVGVLLGGGARDHRMPPLPLWVGCGVPLPTVVWLWGFRV